MAPLAFTLGTSRAGRRSPNWSGVPLDLPPHGRRSSSWPLAAAV